MAPAPFVIPAKAGIQRTIVCAPRIPVAPLLSLLTQDLTQEDLLADSPRLEPEDVRAYTAYAHAVIAGDSLAAP